MAPNRVTCIVESLIDDIESQRLQPGAPLPTHRQLAARHGIAVASASRVYAQLKDRGLVVGEVGRGTFVRARATRREWDSADEARLSSRAADLSFNHPTWPGQAQVLRDMLRELALTGDLAALLHQQPPGGRLHERQVVADFLRRERGIEASAERIFLVGGAQQGLDIAVRAMLQPHDRVAVDALTYPGFRMLASARPLRLEPVAARPDGPDLAALQRLCGSRKVAAIYSMPTLHNPLGWVMPARQRRQLVTIAREHDCLLIEDASYAYLAGQAPCALVGLAAERTAYVGSLSKSLASGLRFGYLLVPDAWAGRVKAAIRASYWSLPGLVTAMATRWMSSGVVSRHERMLRRDARERQAIARQALAGLELQAHRNSPFVWLKLPQDLRMDRIAAALAARDIAVSQASAYATTAHAPHALRLGLSSVPREQLSQVLGEVRACIEGFPV